MGNFNDWFDNMDEDFTNEVGPDLKSYISTGMSLKSLQDLDNRHIHGDNPTDTSAIENDSRYDPSEQDL